MNLFDEKPSQKLVFIDIETTGTKIFEDKITEIGILIYESGKLIQKFETLINPKMEINPFITQITGITNSMVRNAPTFHEISNELENILSNSIFIAHNSGFDYSFIKKEFERIGINFESDHMCTVKLSRNLFPEYTRHNLDEIIARFNLQCNRRHRAYDDAEIIYKFYQNCERSFSEKVFKEAFIRSTKRKETN